MSKKFLSDDKQKSLDFVLKNIDKQFGKGSIAFYDKPVVPIESISTGSIGLDLALGVGGVPRGRVIEIFGPESSSKTTTALHIVASEQKHKDSLCAFIDAEHALDMNYAKNLGVNPSQLLVSQPDYGEQALEIVENLVRSGAVSLIVIDSVAALTPKVEIEGDMSDQQVGVQARLMSKALRKLTSIIQKSNTTVIFINQIRMKIGTMGYGSPETTTGGNALKFYASIRIDVRRIATVKVADQPVAIRVRAKVVKNKVAPPFKQAEYDVVFGKGISKLGELIDHGVKLDIVDKSGAWFSFKDKRLGQGKENSIITLSQNDALRAEIEDLIIKTLQPEEMSNEEIEKAELASAEIEGED